MFGRGHEEVFTTSLKDSVAKLNKMICETYFLVVCLMNWMTFAFVEAALASNTLRCCCSCMPKPVKRMMGSITFAIGIKSEWSCRHHCLYLVRDYCKPSNGLSKQGYVQCSDESLCHGSQDSSEGSFSPQYLWMMATATIHDASCEITPTRLLYVDRSASKTG
jgi:hypothetical protein